MFLKRLEGMQERMLEWQERRFDLMMWRVLSTGILLLCFGIFYLAKGYLFYRDEMNLNQIPQEQIVTGKYGKVEFDSCQGPFYESKDTGGDYPDKKYLYLIPMGIDKKTSRNTYIFLEADHEEKEKQPLDDLVKVTGAQKGSYVSRDRGEKRTVHGVVKPLPPVYMDILEKLEKEGGFAYQYQSLYTPYYVEYETYYQGKFDTQAGRVCLVIGLVVLVLWGWNQGVVLMKCTR